MNFVSSNLNSRKPAQRLQIITAGNGDALLLTKLHLRKTKSGARPVLYYTGSDSLFSEATRMDASASSGSAIAVEQVLKEGFNFFWLTGDAAVLSFDLSRQQYSPAWSDEFNGNGIDTAAWRFEGGFLRNNEHQWYQKENASCRNGLLTIEARRERRPNPDYVAGSNDWRKRRSEIEYTSSSLNTRGRQEWLYGRFEMRARIDTVMGYWPAWWTLGIGKRWPQNGEIDIMEYYTGKVLANLAVADSNQHKAKWWSRTKPVSTFDPAWKDSFHTWRMDWDEEGIGLYLDDRLLNYQPQSRLYNRNDTAFYPFKQKHYMLLNLAIGGDNGGDPSGTVFPLKYEVDYVRVAQKEKGKYRQTKTYSLLTISSKNKAARAASAPE